MEALDESGLLEVASAPDFSQFIKKVELNFQRSQAMRRKQFLLRQKNKQNWLAKSKIIPPSLAKLGQHPTTPNEPESRILHLASFYDYRKTTPFSESEPDLQCLQPSKQIVQKQSRGACKTSHAILGTGSSCERLKQNWKLQFRRDQLNVLQYTREDGFGCDDIGSQKQFRLRRVQRKFEEVKESAKYEMYRTNIERLRGTKTVSPKTRYRAINTRQ